MPLESKDRDKNILEKIKTGDHSCFELLYTRYKGKIYNFILTLSNGDFYLAEEIVQNVFLKIWEMRRELTIEGNFSSFLYMVSRNMFISAMRRKAQDSLYQQSLQNSYCEYENVVEQDIEYKMLEEEVNRLINQLPPAQKHIYQLSKKQNFSNKEIAESLNISISTVESQLYKASSYMRRLLSAHYKVEAFFALIYIQRLF